MDARSCRCESNCHKTIIMPPKFCKKTLASKPSSGTRDKIPIKRKQMDSRDEGFSTLPWSFGSEEQKKRYKILCRRPIIPTRYLDETALNQVGLTQAVESYLHNFDWGNFVMLRYPTYREITLEFLSSFSMEFDPFKELDNGVVKFQLRGEDIVVDLQLINNILNTPHRGSKRYPYDFNSNHAWNELSTAHEYKSGLAKSTQIRDPALRYIHRILSQSVFGRGASTGAVTKTELFCLWSMKHRTPFNTAFWVCSHLLSVATSPTGKICIGGLISAITAFFGFVHMKGTTTRVVGNERLDLNTLMAMKLLQQGAAVAPEGAAESEEETHMEEEPHKASSSPEPVTLAMIMDELRELRTQVQEVDIKVEKVQSELKETRKWTEEKLEAVHKSIQDLRDDRS